MSIENKIEEFVCSGMVIDDHGKWIPIAEKLQKEQRFLSHLERGQILTNGKWISISDKPTVPTSPESAASPVEKTSEVHEETTLDPPPVSPEETVYLTTEEIPPSSDTTLLETIDSTTEAHDETVSFPVGPLRSLTLDSPSEGSTGDTTDYPPETKSIFINPTPPPETTQSIETEFEETVLFNTNAFRNTPTISDNSAGPSTPSNTVHPPSSLEPHLPSRTGIPRTILIIAAITMLIFIVLLKMYC